MKKFRVVIDVLMFLVLIEVMSTPYLMPLFADDTRPGRSAAQMALRDAHIFFGIVLTVLLIVHIIQNWKWMMSICKNFGKLKWIIKFKFLMAILTLVFMTASIVSGVVWWLHGVTNFIRAFHALTSWFAVLVTGIHAGLHFGRFFTLCEQCLAKIEKTVKA